MLLDINRVIRDITHGQKSVINFQDVPVKYSNVERVGSNATLKWT